MPTYRTITLYEYDELSESAKDTARNWYRQGGLDYEWYDFLFEQFEEDMEREGIDVLHSSQKNIGGYTDGKWNPNKEWMTNPPHIYFSGFSYQGDGASFEANVNVARWLRFHKLANKYRKLYNLCKQEGYRIAIRKSGRYNHEYTMNVYSDGTDYPYPDEAEAQYREVIDLVVEDCRNHARTLYRQLEEECDYLNSDESVSETIRINEWTFAEDGKREG